MMIDDESLFSYEEDLEEANVSGDDNTEEYVLDDEEFDIADYFKTDEAVTDYIITDLTLNTITNREMFFYKCVANRVEKLNNEYNDRVEKLLNFIILHCEYSNLPIKLISKVIYSLSKITSAISKGILSIIKE